MTHAEPTPPEYILSGRDPGGRRVTEIVSAQSADEAVRMFEGLGFTEVVLHTDDNVARFITPSRYRPMLSPEEYLGYRTRTRLQCAAFLARKLYQKAWDLYLLCGVLIGMRWALGIDGGWVDVVPVVVCLFPVAFAVYTELTSPAVAYRRVLAAVVRARWEKVPRLLSRVREDVLPPFEAPLRAAQALAGQGRLDEALDRFARMAEDPRVPEHMYWGLRAAICMAGRDHAKALEGYAQAAVRAPGNAPVQVEYALALLTITRDTRRAREVLDRADDHALSDAGLPARLFAEAALALEQGDPAFAVAHLEEAIGRARPFSRGNVLLLVALARMRAYLALARLALGDTAAARREWHRAEPILTPHDMPEAARCREQLG